jgi:hypothetical protein
MYSSRAQMEKRLRVLVRAVDRNCASDADLHIVVARVCAHIRDYKTLRLVLEEVQRRRDRRKRLRLTSR